MTKKDRKVGVCISLQDDLLGLLDQVQKDRKDSTRSATVRVLLLEALGAKSYLGIETKKALGILTMNKSNQGEPNGSSKLT